MRAASLLTPLVALAALLGVDARSSTGDRVLVVLDEARRGDYSRFFGSLKERGFQLSYATPGSREARLEAFGTALYDHLVVFPGNKALSQELAPQALLDAQAEQKINTLLFLSPSADEATRSLLQQYDFTPAPSGYALIDAFSHVGGGEASDVVLASSSIDAAAPVITSKLGPVVFPNGAGFTAGANPFIVDVARAPRTAYAADKSGKPVNTKAGAEVPFAGSSVRVVAGLQTRDNVRVGVVGSAEMVGDKWWGTKLDGKETGNRAFVEDFTKWVLQETGVVRAVHTTHHREGETEPREVYRKKDQVSYAITLQQHETASDGSSVWKPFSVPDLQLEFTMLDPHYRLRLNESSHDSTSTTYTASFMAPDRHGVFKFVVDYFRPGWSYVQTVDKASVVPLRHDEHPRWIAGAYPFYAGAVSSSVAFLVFVGLWMHVGEGEAAKLKAE